MVLGVQRGLIGVLRRTDGGTVGIDGGSGGLDLIRDRVPRIARIGSGNLCRVNQVAAGIGAQDLVGGGELNTCPSSKAGNGQSAVFVCHTIRQVDPSHSSAIGHGVGYRYVGQVHVAIVGHLDGVGEGVTHGDAGARSFFVDRSQFLVHGQAGGSSVFLVVDQNEGGEGTRRNLNTLLCIFQFQTRIFCIGRVNFKFGAIQLVLQIVGIKLPVQSIKVCNVERGVLIRSVRIGPVDLQRFIGCCVGIAVAGVHQVQITEIKLIVFGDGYTVIVCSLVYDCLLQCIGRALNQGVVQ